MLPDREPQPQIVEFGRAPADGSPERGPAWLRYRRLLWPLAIVALLAGAFIVRTQHRGEPSATPRASATAASPAAIGSPSRSPSAAPTVPVVRDLGRPLFDTVAGWELFARTADAIVRIDPAHGRITSTPVPRIPSTGPVSLVVGRDWAVVRPLDYVPGYLVRDGHPAEPLTGALGQGGLAAPGPDGASLWVPVHAGSDRAALVDTAGRPVGPSITMVPGMDDNLIGDGTGYLQFSGVGGSYVARPDGVHRITTGTLLASGPTKWLAYECDDRYHCGMVLVDRGTGARRTVDGPPIDQLAVTQGVFSPDGVHAALVLRSRLAPPTLALIDTKASVTQPAGVPDWERDGDDTMAWSPDGKWLIVTNSNGRLYAVSGDGLGVGDLGLDLPPVIQLTVRRAPLS